MRRRKRAHVSRLEVDGVKHSRSRSVLSGCRYDLTVDIVAFDRHLAIGNSEALRLFTGVRPHGRGNERVRLSREAPRNTGCDVASYHGCLDGDRPASAEGIHEDPVLAPWCQHDDRCSKRLGDGCRTAHTSVTALVQGLSRGIDRYRHTVLDDRDPDRERSSRLGEDGKSVLPLHGLDNSLARDPLDVRGAEKLGLDRIGLRHKEIGVDRKDLVPRQRLNSFKKLIKSGRVKLAHDELDTLRGAQEHVGPGRSEGLSFKEDPSIFNTGNRESETREFPL